MINNALEDKEFASLRNSIHKMAEFVALYEVSEERFKEREKAIEDRLLTSEKSIHQQLTHIKSVLSEYESIMTEVGAARLRFVIDQSLQQSEEHLKNIRYATDEFIRCTDESYQKLNQATDYTVKGLSKAIHSFRMDDFQKVATTSVETVSEVCTKSLSKMNEVIKWFHWRNIALVLSITIIVTMITGLYINDEWPWQTHEQIMQQRQLAVAVVAAWPHLSNSDQQEILHTATQSVA